VTYAFWKLPPDSLTPPITWDVVKLDCGSYSCDPSNFVKRVYPVDKDGTKSLTPGSVVLDGNSHVGSKDSPVWNTFQVHLIADFSGLNLPNL
jgi:hypothetical protein